MMIIFLICLILVVAVGSVYLVSLWGLTENNLIAVGLSSLCSEILSVTIIFRRERR